MMARRRPMTSRVQIRKFTPFRNDAGTVLGFLDAEMPSGMIINGMKLMGGPKGGFWIALPAVKRLNPDGTERLNAKGKVVWDPIVEFANCETADKFRDLVLDALREQRPQAFETTARREPALPCRHKNPSRQKYPRGETVNLPPDDNVVQLFR